ncbi:unnamed protein product (macronuclear) [Paramecium tetraurelia]|uniref:Transmembrane protein n=1 Tax=Paramecium tetraurelia TaxID=5888 RepID=A0CMS1_PARTE|nr:uncharacterized protein GSPATT00008567001 [Paramecium tetraurelia]CAK72088.1 unnamed protein product [Paramecium tetraurelia]|eukprot:XP_001439485.1 hypothetical protein (macronuclear) [Paramecium tetraurelia strain d4-2]
MQQQIIRILAILSQVTKVFINKLISEWMKIKKTNLTNYEYHILYVYQFQSQRQFNLQKLSGVATNKINLAVKILKIRSEKTQVQQKSLRKQVPSSFKETKISIVYNMKTMRQLLLSYTQYVTQKVMIIFVDKLNYSKIKVYLSVNRGVTQTNRISFWTKKI